MTAPGMACLTGDNLQYRMMRPEAKVSLAEPDQLQPFTLVPV